MTQLQKNKLELFGQKTYKNIENVLTIKREKERRTWLETSL